MADQVKIPNRLDGEPEFTRALATVPLDLRLCSSDVKIFLTGGNP